MKKFAFLLAVLMLVTAAASAEGLFQPDTRTNFAGVAGDGGTTCTYMKLTPGASASLYITAMSDPSVPWTVEVCRQEGGELIPVSNYTRRLYRGAYIDLPYTDGGQEGRMYLLRFTCEKPDQFIWGRWSAG